VYTFDDPPKATPAAAARHIASLQLPALPDNVFSMANLSCRCDPAPSPSAQSKAFQRGYPRIYELASSNRVLCLHTVLTTADRAQGQFAQCEGTLFVPFAAILNAVVDLYEQPFAPVSIAWGDWCQQTSWVDTGRIDPGNEYFVYGQRVVIAGIDHDEAVGARKRAIVVLDFDPIRLKRRTAPNDDGEPGLKLFDPESETILSGPVDDDALWDMFLGGTCKANARFAVQTSHTGRRRNSPSCVMIDDEHSKHLFTSALTLFMTYMHFQSYFYW
jgi:hypothetical protein